jgi:TolA-binding protein
MPRVLILAVLLAAGFPAVAQIPASDPPPSSTTSEPKPPQDAPSSTEQDGQTEPQSAQTDPSKASAGQGQPARQDASSGKKEEEKKGALGRLKKHVKDHFSTGCVGAGTVGGCWGDNKDKKSGQQQGADKNPSPPRSSESRDPEVSSSRDTQIDLNPPGQEKPARLASKGPDDVQEMKHYDPHAAEKDVEVGEFYLKRGNLKGAIARFRSALYNKPNDALATFSLAQALEKAGQLEEARQFYEKYLQILPKGEFAAECTAALGRLPKPDGGDQPAAPSTSAPAETPPSKR